METVQVRGTSIDLVRRGKGPPLLFLHSGAGPVSHSATYLEQMTEKFDVIAPVHPGFGLQKRPDCVKTVDDLAYHYLDLMHALGLNEVILVGAAFGGWIASEIAVRCTQRISKLVLIDPFGIKVKSREEREIADFFAVSPADRATMEFTKAPFSNLTYAGKSEEELMVLARGLEAEAFFGWSPFMHNPRLAHWLHRIAVPTLIVRGAQDEIVSMDNHRAYVERIPDCRMELIEGAGVFPHIEAPEAFNLCLTKFAAARTSKITTQIGESA
ncbi:MULTISPECIES: alpha/beta fold hydrolase [unclassified Rhizobium]|uniref:alpha/beta fold hydrolase n=1 Tax=unclassified Rhizobium TaxID=2613769 RepID=UPI000BDCB284|nr:MULTISPECIES: alpha/beta hydrolase [unclassified Rhizobium]MDH7809587.1 pimeloyl-ACP methyl ester carboxylesterase [Rhizobium sp. AN67]MDQ4408822.1 alpha/beta hydrolase [Rhizobium sp. AN63]SOD50567.1 Pimeloyl-ACP methyl ester carboxylesterase [Rhizobium sp. AN6A]